MWGWNESGQLALPSKALAEERAQDKDVGAGLGAVRGAVGGAGFLAAQCRARGSESVGLLSVLSSQGTPR